MCRFRCLTAFALCLVVVLGVTGAASAAATHGVLTQPEYRQLQLVQTRIRSLEAADARSFQKANAVCTHMRQVSQLIVAVRSGCLDLIRLGGDDGKLNARATKCGIDPGTESALLRCLVPAVRGYSSDAATFFRAESRVDQLARLRGFSPTCVAVIGDSPGNIAAEGRLAHALKTAVGALRQANPDALQALFSQIQADVRSIRAGPRSLSPCPHR